MSARNFIAHLVFWCMWRTCGSRQIRLRNVSIRFICTKSDSGEFIKMLPFESLFSVVLKRLGKFSHNCERKLVRAYIANWEHKLVYRSRVMRSVVIPLSIHDETRRLTIAMRIAEEYAITVLQLSAGWDEWDSDEREFALEQILDDELLRSISELL